MEFRILQQWPRERTIKIYDGLIISLNIFLEHPGTGIKKIMGEYFSLRDV